MKKSNLFLFITAIVLVSIVILTVSFQAQKIDVSGTWNMVVETGQGNGNPVIVLKQVNDTIITGTYTGQFGEALLKGKVKAGKISFQILTPDVTIDYVGTVEGHAMKGRVIFGSYGEGTFTGKKKEN
jgi:hypothetical protein